MGEDGNLSYGLFHSDELETYQQAQIGTSLQTQTGAGDTFCGHKTGAVNPALRTTVDPAVQVCYASETKVPYLIVSALVFCETGSHNAILFGSIHSCPGLGNSMIYPSCFY